MKMASNLRLSLLRLRPLTSSFTRRKFCRTSVAMTLVEPRPDGAQKTYSPKLEEIYDSISKLTIMEIAELSDLLRTRLKLPDPSMMSFSAAPVAASAESEEDVEPETKQTNFTVKLVRYDESKKIALIKQLRDLFPDMNLVQAKKFIESAPGIVKEDVGQTEANAIKEALAKVGAEIVIS